MFVLKSLFGQLALANTKNAYSKNPPLFIHNLELLGVRPGVKTGLFNMGVKGLWGYLKLNRMLRTSQRPKVKNRDGHKIVGLTLLSKHIRELLFLGHRKIIYIDIHAGFLLLWWMVTILAPIMVSPNARRNIILGSGHWDMCPHWKSSPYNLCSWQL